MKLIRKLFIQNENGERRGLNGETGAYASDLAGFGFSLAPSFSDLSRGFFSVSSEENEPQNSLGFTIVLTRSAYASHQALVDWLAASEVLTIVYNPTGRQEYFRDVSVSFLQKGELNQVGWLEMPCSFTCRTPWYLPRPTALNISKSDKTPGKQYSYRYSPSLRYGSDNAAHLEAFLAGTGHIPGAIKLTFRGAVSNPLLRLVGRVSGRTYGICKLATTLSETDALEYSSLYENSYVQRVNAAGSKEDLLDFLDLSLTPFFRVPVNEPCTLSIEADDAVVGRAELLVYYYYRSV